MRILDVQVACAYEIIIDGHQGATRNTWKTDILVLVNTLTTLTRNVPKYSLMMKYTCTV